MKLPFLKNKSWPRIAKPMEEKSYGLDPSEEVEYYLTDELFDAAQTKHVSAFRNALEALVLNCLEDEEELSDG